MLRADELSSEDPGCGFSGLESKFSGQLCRSLPHRRMLGIL
jgi:hypothetical protein